MSISHETLKEILLSNENFILKDIKEVVPRTGPSFPTNLKKVIILYGVRRAGKSFILYDLFRQKQEQAFYIDFEDERLEEFKMSDFEKLKECIFELKPHLIQKQILLLLDEVQNIAGWEKFARRVVERENFSVVATGSSSKIMPQEIHTALRGRSWSIEVFPFSFYEYLQARQINTRDKSTLYSSKKAVIKNLFTEYLKWGGFPEVTFMKVPYEKRKILREYLEAMFFKDLVERFQIKNVLLLDHLKEKLFSSFALKFSTTSFYKQNKDKFAFSKDSAFHYERYFQESMLLFKAQKLSESAHQRLRNPAKIYLVDTGLARKVTSSDSGRLLENLVFLELLRRGHEIFYFENKRECDFATKRDDRWSVYQVTWQVTETNTKREIEGLIEACEFLRLKKGTLLTSDSEGEEKHKGVHIMIKPVWKWLMEDRTRYKNEDVSSRLARLYGSVKKARSAPRL